MATLQSVTSAQQRNTRSSVSGANTTLFLDRAKLQTIRRSTPDSDALVSSDEEHDLHQSLPSLPQSGAVGQKPMMRRSSWLSEIAPNNPGQRKVSFSGSALSNTQPSTPAGENGPWTATTPNGRGSTSGASYSPWGAQIWTSEARKDPPARLTEVVQSPTSIGESFSEDIFKSQKLSDAESGFPFVIPTKPIIKPVRSLSYSVGQQESEASGGHPPHLAQGLPSRTARGLAPLKHRLSRPSLLNNTAPTIREDEDDESLGGSEAGVRSTTEQGGDAGLQSLSRQALYDNRFRHRSATTGTSSNGRLLSQGINSRVSTYPESDYAIEEAEDDIMDSAKPQNGVLARRMSEFVPQNRFLDNARHGSLRSSVGFGGFDEGQQSRRHSFAGNAFSYGYTVRQNEEEENIGSDLANALSPTSRGDLTQPLPQPDDDPSYFGGYGVNNRAVGQSSALVVDHDGPHHNPYDPHVRPQKRLYVVAFKCARADVYYIHENTGLEVKPGDMVIVEGDRGIDLGTVTYGPVSMKEAKIRKDEAKDDHVRWLLMFSRYAQGLLAASGADHPSAVGGMGPRAPNRHNQYQGHHDEIKPKMIKRLAQPHEIQKLKDKEGGEAKAKRQAQSKVLDHGLNMEILDAEYQLDQRKLTFYYFAETYINFNDLVTDLFKVYKTRIWMSAVNPTSMINPHGSLIAPSAIAPGATTVQNPQVPPSMAIGVGFGRNNGSSPRGSPALDVSPRAPESAQNYPPDSQARYLPFMHQLNPPIYDVGPPHYMGGHPAAWEPGPRSPWPTMYNPFANPAHANGAIYPGYPPSTFPASPTTIPGPAYGLGPRNGQMQTNGQVSLAESLGQLNLSSDRGS